jgi:peptidoglycan/xylan/chitin deacetylase (PgdA/CDA1 family)
MVLSNKAVYLYNYLNFLRSRWQQKDREVVFLMIHGVSDKREKESWEPLRPRIDVKRLEGIVSFLSKYYQFVSLDEGLDIMSGRKVSNKNSMVLTFDDGYRNNVQFALPVLKRHKIVPTIYLVTGQIERRQPFWFDRLDYALQQVDVSGRKFEVRGKVIRIRSNKRKDLQTGYRQLREAAKQVPRGESNLVAEMEQLADSLESESGRCLGDFFEKDHHSALLNWQEIEKAGEDGAVFGSHTVNHLRLGLADEQSIYYQLHQSRETIEAHTGRPCIHLCYPSGSFNDQAVNIARKLNYESAVTTVPGLNWVGETDLLRLRRIYLPEIGSLSDMLRLLSGLNGLKFKRGKTVELGDARIPVLENPLGD